MREIVFTRAFDHLFRRLPKEVRDAAYEKLALYLENPAHPSLRVKRVKGTAGIWEMALRQAQGERMVGDRVTLEMEGERVLLRRVGTHDVLRQP